MPSSAGSAEVTIPSAVTWQVLPGGHSPSTIPATARRRPDSSTPRSRWLARGGVAISTVAGNAGAAPSCPVLSPGSGSPVWRARRTRRASAWSRAASRVGVMTRPGTDTPVRPSGPGNRTAASAAVMMTSAGPAGWPGSAWASRPARIARAAAAAPGPVRPRPPRAAISTGISCPSRTPRTTTPGCTGTSCSAAGSLPGPGSGESVSREVAARRSAAMAAGSGGSSGRRLEAAAAAGR